VAKEALRLASHKLPCSTRVQQLAVESVT
jgi:ribosomal protein L16/L10AE